MLDLGLVESRLQAATADAPPLKPWVEKILRRQSAPHCLEENSQVDVSVLALPPLTILLSALRLPVERSSLPPLECALPRRVISDACAEHEPALWRTYWETGLHELHSREMLDALAKHVRRALAPVVLGGLSARAELNGAKCEVIGPLDPANGRLPVRVVATRECVRVRLTHAFGRDSLPVVLEVGAGSGALAHHLASRLVGYATVVATDNGSSRIAQFAPIGVRPLTCAQFDEGGGDGTSVVQLDCEASLVRYEPRLVLCSWMPSGVDWSGAFRAASSVASYVLLGEADGGTCGDGWATWGVLPPNAEEYSLDEDSTPPHAEQRFEREPAEVTAEITAAMACRFDSAAARGFSSAVSFRRSDGPVRRGGARYAPARQGKSGTEEADEAAEAEGETLEASWERMQRSLVAGRAERLAVEQDVQVTRD